MALVLWDKRTLEKISSPEVGKNQMINDLVTVSTKEDGRTRRKQ